MYVSFSLGNSNGGFAEHLSWRSLWWLLLVLRVMVKELLVEFKFYKRTHGIWHAIRIFIFLFPFYCISFLFIPPFPSPTSRVVFLLNLELVLRIGI